MSGLTLITCLVLMLPVVFVKFSGALKRFYWRGFWIFPMLIALIAGGHQVLLMLNIEITGFIQRILAGLTVAYIVFVVFAWIRLSLVTIIGLAQRYLRRDNSSNKETQLS